MWQYIDENGIKLSPMYTDGGMNRTGCMFCPVPIAHGDCRNLEYARKHHPKMYETIMVKFRLLDMLRKVQINNGQQDLFEEAK